MGGRVTMSIMITPVHTFEIFIHGKNFTLLKKKWKEAIVWSFTQKEKGEGKVVTECL